MGIAISRVGSVGASHISGISSQYSSIVNNAYNVSNESEVSAAYTERVKAPESVNGVSPSDPVTYSNAVVQKNKVNQVDSSIETNRAYNALADEFSGQSVSYDRYSRGSSYEMVGAHYDAYA